jgi:hypothetical protein
MGRPDELLLGRRDHRTDHERTGAGGPSAGSPSQGQTAVAGGASGGWTLTVSSDGIRIHRTG